MRRAFSSSTSGTHSFSPAGARETPAPRAEYVINWPAIAASLVLLAVLVGVPAGIYVWRPSLFRMSHDQGGGLDPLVVTVDPAVSRPPPYSADDRPTRAARLKQARDTEADAVDRNDTTRRIIRSRFRRTPREETDSDDANDGAVAAVDPGLGSLPPAAENSPAAESPAAGERRNTRLNQTMEADLLAILSQEVPELRLDDTGDLSSKLVRADSSLVLQKLVSQREDLAGLPFRWDGACKLEARKAAALQGVSRTMRRVSFRSSRLAAGGSYSEKLRAEDLRSQYLTEKLLDGGDWVTPDHVPALEQMLQTEGVSLSLTLVESLSRIPGPEAARALARRALYDISPYVRTEAVEALKQREAAQYEDVLTAGFRYPWAVVAMNAADALIELEAKETVPQLVAMLDLPPPTAPQRNEEGKWTVRELVKVNHLRNCTLCHAPATTNSAGDIPGFVPTLGKPLPEGYYNQSSGDFVRADTTYLRQDFSLMLEVNKADPWPAVQRFDFLVRTRVLPPEEQARLDQAPPSGKDSPQRDALLYALRHLQGNEAESQQGSAQP